MSGGNGHNGNGNGKRGPGRIPLFESDPELRARMLRLARTLRSDKELCQVVGIHPDTFCRWKREQGEAYRRFRRELQRARIARKSKLERTVEAAAKDDWKAAAWLLSRVHPEEFSEKRILEHRRSDKGKRREAIRDPEVRDALDRAASRLGATLEAKPPR